MNLLRDRYQIDVPQVKAGNWVLIKGVDASIVKTATITDVNEDEDSPVFIFKPIVRHQLIYLINL
jgi:U5 small nuclear ribonucleoprotein component